MNCNIIKSHINIFLFFYNILLLKDFSILKSDLQAIYRRKVTKNPEMIYLYKYINFFEFRVAVIYSFVPTMT